MYYYSEHSIKKSNTKQWFDAEKLLSSIDLSRCQHWDDFFDFSRMRIPHDVYTAFVRCNLNMRYRYAGNYIQLLGCLMTMIGVILLRFKFFISTIMVGLVWALLTLVCKNDIQRWPQKWAKEGKLMTQKIDNERKVRPLSLFIASFRAPSSISKPNQHFFNLCPTSL